MGKSDLFGKVPNARAGAGEPIATDATMIGRTRNRRVEVIPLVE